ncbi:MAG: pyridoxine 5'-phosphate synthase [Burkholderiaceae bacterium]
MNSQSPRTALSVNLNKVALVRNTRALELPNVTRAAELCLQAGAHGITVHPRPDQRHIRDADVPALAMLLQQWPGREFNIEGNPLHNLMDHVRAVRPTQATFVPDAEGQSTSDHGWDLEKDVDRLRPLIDKAHALGVRVSLFMDPVPQAMAAARAIGADRVELYTETYARAFGTPHQADVLAAFTAAGKAAQAAGLEVNAGHDLNRLNLTTFLRAVPDVREVSIGHAFVGDALELGYSAAVAAYLQCIDAASDQPASARGTAARSG